MNLNSLWVLTLGALLVGSVRAEEIVVVVNTEAGPISKEQIQDIYMARSRSWIPIDQSASSTIYGEFYKKAIDRDAAQIKAIWSKILFTGRGMPPKQLADSAAVKKAVAGNVKAIGYIERSAVDSSVRVVLSIN